MILDYVLLVKPNAFNYKKTISEKFAPVRCVTSCIQKGLEGYTLICVPQ